MGLLDRLKNAKRYLYSPLQIAVADSDAVAHAGGQATVVVDLTGEQDETVQDIELLLRLNDGDPQPLGHAPVTLGRHAVAVQLPAGLAPTSEYTQYFFVARPRRSKGAETDVLTAVRVVGRPEDLFWPDRPRAQSDGLGVSIELDAETANLGASISGRVLAPAGQKVKVEVGPVHDRTIQVEGEQQGKHTVEFKPAAAVELREPGAFSLALPVEHPPTLRHGMTFVYWEVRASAGGVQATHVFGVLDPDSLCVVRRTGSLAGLIGGTPH